MTNTKLDSLADNSDSPSGDTLSEAQKEDLARWLFPDDAELVTREAYKKVLSGAATLEEEAACYAQLYYPEDKDKQQDFKSLFFKVRNGDATKEESTRFDRIVGEGEKPFADWLQGISQASGSQLG